MLGCKGDEDGPNGFGWTDAEGDGLPNGFGWFEVEGGPKGLPDWPDVVDCCGFVSMPVVTPKGDGFVSPPPTDVGAEG